MLIDTYDVVLHIGAHKTGSSSIQHGLCALAGDLAAGTPPVLVPQTGLKSNAHHGLRHELHKTGKAGPLFDALKAEVAAFPSNKAVLSSEGFELLRPPVLADAMHGTFGEGRVVVVKYMRDRPGSVLARWNQGNKNKWTWHTFDTFVRKVDRSLPDRLFTLRSILGDRLVVFPFTMPNVVHHFFETAFGADNPATQKAAALPRVNSSRTTGAMLLMERARPRLHELVQARGLSPTDREGQIMIQAMCATFEKLEMPEQPKLRYSRDLAEVLHKRQRERMRAVDDRFFVEDRFMERNLDALLDATPPGTELLTAEEVTGRTTDEIDEIIGEAAADAAALLGRRRAKKERKRSHADA